MISCPTCAHGCEARDSILVGEELFLRCSKCKTSFDAKMAIQDELHATLAKAKDIAKARAILEGVTERKPARKSVVLEMFDRVALQETSAWDEKPAVFSVTPDSSERAEEKSLSPSAPPPSKHLAHPKANEQLVASFGKTDGKGKARWDSDGNLVIPIPDPKSLMGWEEITAQQFRAKVKPKRPYAKPLVALLAVLALGAALPSVFHALQNAEPKQAAAHNAQM